MKKLLLVDQNGSMTPFHRFTQELVEATSGQAEAFYFQNSPATTVYRDRYLTQSAALAEAFELVDQDAEVLIVSDAGAARGYRSLHRVRGTASFLLQAKRHTSQLSWLNPMPESRWEGSSAEIIAHMVTMFHQWSDFQRLGYEAPQEECPACELPDFGPSRDGCGERTEINHVLRRFNHEGYRDLLFHAAFPSMLTAESMHFLRLHFCADSPPEAVADLLLSSLFSQASYEDYVMDSHVRAYLLTLAKASSCWCRRRAAVVQALQPLVERYAGAAG